MPAVNPLLAARDGRLFLAAQALDSVSLGFAGVVLPWLVLQGGGSHAAAGLVYPVTLVPYLAFGLPAGALADRLPRRTVMLVSHALQAAFGTAIPLWTISGQPPLALIFAAAFAIGSGRVFADAAAFGAVAAVVGPEQFTGGQAMLSAAWSIGLFAGPALGGALIGLVGAGFAMTAEAAAFVLAAVLILAIRSPFHAGPAEPAGQPPGAIREALGFMLRDPVVRTYTAVTFFSPLASAGDNALLVPLFRDGIGLSAGAVGWLLGAAALASALASPAVAPLCRRFGAGKVAACGLLLTPLPVAGLAAASGVGTALAALLPFELLSWSMGVLWIGERQRRAPERLQARVGITGRMITLAGATAGAGWASGLAGALTITQVYLVMAAAALAVGACAAPLILRLER